jgi:drug/metabolite transporter (DMT)-like permease
MGAVCGDGRHLGHPLPADQDRRGRDDARQPGPSLRTAIGAALLLPVAAARGWLAPLFPSWRWVLVYTIVEVSLPWFLLADGERRLSSSLTGLMIAAVPLIAAVLQLLTRGDDRLDRRRVTGLLVGMMGVAILVGLNVSFKDLGAVAEVGLVAIGYAAGPIIIPGGSPACRPWGSSRHHWC